MRNRTHLYFFLLLTSTLSLQAFALNSVDIDNAAREAERIQREEQLRQQQQFERDRSSARPPTQIETPQVEPNAVGVPGACKHIDEIVLTGAKHLSKQQIIDLVKPYQGLCIGVGEIEALLGDITRIYIKRGFIASRAYVPQQDLSSGRMEILVIEGSVNRIQLEKKPGDENQKIDDESSSQPDLYLDNIFPGVVGEPLNLRDIEQGLDQINRLSSNNASMNIRPGDEVGESMVVIYNTPAKRWHSTINADNQGSRATGRNQAALTLSLDNPLGINDFISITRRQAVPDKDGEGSSSENYSYVLPYGYNTFSFGASDSRYESTLVTGSGVSLQSRGDSHNQFVRDDYVAWRNQTSRLTLSTTLTRKETNNYLAGLLLGVSSRRLTVLDISSALTTEVYRGVLSLEAGYSRGLNTLGALDDADYLPGDAARAQFEKYTYGVSYSHAMTLAGLNGSISSQLSGQHALDVLYGSEQISIGGIYSVRGFYEISVAGDNGYFLRNDFSLQKPLGNLFGKTIVAKPYLALDAGDVHSIAVDTPAGALVGAAIGTTFFSGPLLFDVMIGHPLYQADSLGKQEGTSTFFRFSCNI